jgi:predicted metal-dependent enzyme (double-stranded beta helix superfamily)
MAPAQALILERPEATAAAIPLAALIAEIDAACTGAEPDGRRMVAALRTAVARRDLLTPDQRLADGGCYARHLLYCDPDDRFTIVAIVWGPGQFSPSHGHHTWCAYAVHENPLMETLYTWEPTRGTARATRTDVRPPGYGCFARAGLDQIHRLGNSGAEPAISIHVYGVDGARVRTHVNRIVDIGPSAA